MSPSRLSLVVRALVLAGLSLPVHTLLASEAAAPVDKAKPSAAKTLDRVTVSATKSPRKVAEVVGAVDVLETEQLENQLACDIKDSLRYLPGVSVRNNGTRFGLSDINIRGLDGNRVLIEVDGVRVSDAFAIGSFSNANRNFVDIDTVKSVEVVRGAASSLYGSNAIGGVVSFRTKDPEDYLRPGEDTYLGAKLGWFSDSEESLGSVTAAAGDGAVSALLHVVGRSGHETENQGSNSAQNSTRTEPNPQDTSNQAGLAKFVWTPTLGQRLRLTLDQDRGDTDTEVYSARTTTVMPAGPGATSTIRVQDLDGEDHQERSRVQLDYEFEHVVPGVDAGLFQVYTQDSETEQKTYESRESTTVRTSGTTVTPVRRFREFTFDQDAQGAELTLASAFETGAAGHYLTYGAEWTETDTAQRRDGRATNLTTGVTTSVVTPDVFPVRDFPLSTTTETGLYVQDEISLLDGALSLVPGLRYDRFELDSELDPIFAGDNPGLVPADTDDHETSPRLGALYQLTPELSVFGQWATGFRAPPYADVNIGFTNLQFGYTAIPNPDLKPEQSENLEAGLRGRHDWGFWELTAFHNEYEDFIESTAVVNVSSTGFTTFQSINIDEATIEGAELRAGLDLASLAGWEGWGLNTALGYTRGEDEASGEPLNSIDPAKLVLGLTYDAPSGDWGTEFITTAVQGKKHVDESAGALFQTPGYATFDLLGRYRINEHLSLRGGLFNLTDKTYWDWADVRGQSASSAVLDRYTRPGRNAGLTLSLTF